jgi:hypothetical protein
MNSIKKSESGKLIQESLEKLVPFQQVFNVVQKLKLLHHEKFELLGKRHQLIFTDIEFSSPIEYYKSTQVSGCDIYIWESMRGNGEDLLLFTLVHELSEISFKSLSLDSHNAHKMAILYERKYLSFMNEQKEKDFMKFARDLRGRYQ